MKKIFYFTVAAMAVMSCAKEIQNQDIRESESTVVWAAIDNELSVDGAKTTLVDVDGNRFIRWAENDVIGIYGSGATQNVSGDLYEDSIGETEGKFLVGGSFTSPKFAYYPYSEDVIYFNNKLDGVQIPAEQTYAEGKVFDGTACVMVGVYDSGSQTFKFRNACSIMEIQLTGTETISELQLCSLSKPLAGYGSVNTDSAPVFKPDQTAGAVSNVIKMKFKNGIQLTSTPKPFYFVVAPGQYDDLLVRVKTADGIYYTNASTKGHTLVQRHILPMNAMAAGKPSTAGAVSLSGQGFANTYTVAPDKTGVFCFDVKHVDGNAFAKGESDPLKNGMFADVLWESEACLIGNVYYDAEEGKIYFTKTHANSGNALISLFNKEETIVWNWLIWCSDVKDQTWGAEGSRYTFQDRFLGATWVPASASEANLDNVDYTPSTGFFYQYGRYIPTPGPNTLRPGVRYEGEAVTSGYSNVDGNPLNKDVLKTYTWQPVFHPFFEKYSGGWEARNQLWEFDEMSAHPLSMNKIWNSQSPEWASSYVKDIHVTGSKAIWAVNKTNYDPCPVGYRVPQMKELNNFNNDGNGELEYVNGTAPYKQNSKYPGAYTTREGNFIWLPKAGMRTFGGGDNNSNGYSYTVAYWGTYKHANKSGYDAWYDGSINIWTFNPNDTQLTLTGCMGYGTTWKTPATGDVHARFFHMTSESQGPRTFEANGKPVVGSVGEGMSIRCVKIQ